MTAKIKVDTLAALQAWNKGMDPALTALDVNFEPATVPGPAALVSALADAAEKLTQGYVDGGEYLAHLSLGFIQAMDNLDTTEQRNAAIASGRAGH